MYKFLIALCLISCDPYFVGRGSIINSNGNKINNPVEITVQLGEGKYQYFSDSSGKYKWVLLSKWDTVLVYVNDSLFLSDTVIISIDDYEKNKLWEKDLNIHVRKRKND